MHVLLLAEIAAQLAHHGPTMLCRSTPASPESVSHYWAASRGRIELWNQSLARFQRAKASGDTYRLRCWWDQHTGVLEEILVSELLTRVVAALGDAIDRRTNADELSPITQAIHLSHLEARNRVQSAILDRRGCRVSEAVRLNQLRRHIESWIDRLVGTLAATDPHLIHFGIDGHRTWQHAQDARDAPGSATRPTTHWLARVALYDSLRRKCAVTPSLPNANRAVADSVVRLLPQTLFDSLGTPKSLSQVRLESPETLHNQPAQPWLPNDLHAWSASTSQALITDATLAQWFR